MTNAGLPPLREDVSNLHFRLRGKGWTATWQIPMTAVGELSVTASEKDVFDTLCRSAEVFDSRPVWYLLTRAHHLPDSIAWIAIGNIVSWATGLPDPLTIGGLLLLAWGVQKAHARSMDVFDSAIT